MYKLCLFGKWVGSAKTKHIRCIYNVFKEIREITKYMVLAFWPTLVMVWRYIALLASWQCWYKC